MRSFATDKLAQTAASQSIILTLLNGILIGSYKTTTMINNFTMIVGIAFAFLGGMYVSKHGVKKSTTFWSWVSIGVAAMTCGFCIILGKDGMIRFLWLLCQQLFIVSLCWQRLQRV